MFNYEFNYAISVSLFRFYLWIICVCLDLHALFSFDIMIINHLSTTTKSKIMHCGTFSISEMYPAPRRSVYTVGLWDKKVAMQLHYKYMLLLLGMYMYLLECYMPWIIHPALPILELFFLHILKLKHWWDLRVRVDFQLEYLLQSYALADWNITTPNGTLYACARRIQKHGYCQWLWRKDEYFSKINCSWFW